VWGLERRESVHTAPSSEETLTLQVQRDTEMERERWRDTGPRSKQGKLKYRNMEHQDRKEQR
jgi:hypothetical protein